MIEDVSWHKHMDFNEFSLVSAFKQTDYRDELLPNCIRSLNDGKLLTQSVIFKFEIKLKVLINCQSSIDVNIHTCLCDWIQPASVRIKRMAFFSSFHRSMEFPLNMILIFNLSKASELRKKMYYIVYLSLCLISPHLR